MKFFEDLNRNKVPFSHDQYLAFVIVEDKKIYRVIIDYRDGSSIEKSAYDWCDIYARINFNKELTDTRFLTRIISIPPGFGISIWNLLETFYYCSKNLIVSKFNPPVCLRRFIGVYYLQYLRPGIKEYITKKQN